MIKMWRKKEKEKIKIKELKHIWFFVLYILPCSL